MKEDFAVDEDGFTKDGYRILDPVSMKAMYFSSIMLFAVLAVTVFVTRTLLAGSYPDEETAISVILLSALVLGGIYLAVRPRVYYDHYRYRLDDEKLEVRKGLFIITHTMVPIERIHQVEVSRGPVDRHFGLASVVATTAGGIVSVGYLDEGVAEGIASKLNDSVIGILKQRE